MNITCQGQFGSKFDFLFYIKQLLVQECVFYCVESRHVLLIVGHLSRKSKTVCCLQDFIFFIV